MENADGMFERANGPVRSVFAVALLVAMSGFADAEQSVTFFRSIGQFVEVGISGGNEVLKRDHSESVKG